MDVHAIIINASYQKRRLYWHWVPLVMVILLSWFNPMVSLEYHYKILFQNFNSGDITENFEFTINDDTEVQQSCSAMLNGELFIIGGENKKNQVIVYLQSRRSYTLSFYMQTNDRTLFGNVRKLSARIVYFEWSLNLPSDGQILIG